MSNQYTYEQIAEDFSLWVQFVDPKAEMSEEEFDALSTAEKVKL